MEGKEVILTIMLMLCWNVESSVTFNSIVAQDGTGNFTTITNAINAAPSQSATTYFIHVKAGNYSENVIVGYDKTNISLIGDGMGITIVSANRSCSMGFLTNDTATLGVYGDGFIGMNMTIINTAGAGAEQAVALTSAAKFVSFYQCGFEGYQDTIFAQIGVQFFRECEIYGTIDFIFGDGQAYFQNSVILARMPLPGQEVTILAPGYDPAALNSGLILQNCTITPTSELRQNSSVVKSYLGRPWKDHSTAVIMSSFIDDFIDPQGWLQWNGTNVYLAEFNNTGPGTNTTGRTSWSTIISGIELVSKFTVRNFIQGDKWIPDIIPHYLDLDDDDDDDDYDDDDGDSV